MFGPLRDHLPRVGRGPRLAAAGICLLLAISSATSSHRDGGRVGPRAATVVVAAADLPAGHRLGRRDLAVVQWPIRLRPAGTSAAPAALLGRRLAQRIGVREAITTTRLVGADLAAGLGRSTVAAAVGLDDSYVTELVRAGDTVDIMETPRPVDVPDASPGGEPAVTLVGRGVRVLAVLPVDTAAQPGTAAATATEVVVAVPRPVAVRLARDQSTQLFTIAVDPP